MEERVLYLASVLVLGIATQWIAWRLRLPAILLLLVFGFAIGQLDFANTDRHIGELLFPFVSLSVAVILFEGGLSLQFSELRETGRAFLRLVTAGVIVTWGLTTVAARWLLEFDWSIAALLGAILVVSGPTVIIPLLRHVRPNRRTGSIVKWEGIVNDPIGAVLAVLVFEAVKAGGLREATATTLYGLFMTAAVGGVVGVGAAIVLIQLLKRFLIPDYLQSAVFLAATVAAFAGSNLIQRESGLVTVTVLGIILANQRTVSVNHVIEFKENLRVLLISTLFILLASRLRLNDLTSLGFAGLIFLAALLVIRPVAVFLTTIGTELNVKEKWFLAWMAPRGIVAAAVSSLFALEMLELAEAGFLVPEVAEQARRLVPVTFLVIVGTVTTYGLTAAPLARKLQIAEPNPQGILFGGGAPHVRAIASAVREAGFRVILVDTNHQNIAAARMAGLQTCAASILSEYVGEELDVSGVGRLLAMTPNDEVNAMAAMDFAPDFGRAEVYQLAPAPTRSTRQESVALHMRGRLLFGKEMTNERLAERFASGAIIKKTPLTEEFDYEAFRELYGETAVILFVIQKDGMLIVATADATPSPKPGQTLISLVDPVEEPAKEKKEA